jgi:hypothetical protein
VRVLFLFLALIFFFLAGLVEYHTFRPDGLIAINWSHGIGQVVVVVVGFSVLMGGFLGYSGYFCLRVARSLHIEGKNWPEDDGRPKGEMEPASDSTGLTIGTRRFADWEVSLILERASESEVALDQSGRGSGGLTLGEIQEIAGEAGIDPGQVTLAACAVDTATGQVRRGLLGVPTTVQFGGALDVSVQASEISQSVSAIGDAFERQGKVGETPDTVEWELSDVVGRRNVSLRIEPGRTVFAAHGDFRRGALLYFVAFGAVGGLVGVWILASFGVLGMRTLPVIAGTVAAPAWLLWRLRFRREVRDLRRAVYNLQRSLLNAFPTA